MRTNFGSSDGKYQETLFIHYPLTGNVEKYISIAISNKF